MHKLVSVAPSVPMVAQRVANGIGTPPESGAKPIISVGPLLDLKMFYFYTVEFFTIYGNRKILDIG